MPKIIELNISPSDRSRCRECQKLIAEASMRGVALHPYEFKSGTRKGFRIKAKHYFCHRCSEKIFLREITSCKFALKKIKEWRRTKEGKKAIEIETAKFIMEKL